MSGAVDQDGDPVRFVDAGNLSVLGGDSWKWLLVGPVSMSGPMSGASPQRAAVCRRACAGVYVRRARRVRRSGNEATAPTPGGAGAVRRRARLGGGRDRGVRQHRLPRRPVEHRQGRGGRHRRVPEAVQGVGWGRDPGLEQNQSVQNGQVRWAGVVGVDDDSATVIAATTGTVSNVGTQRRAGAAQLSRQAHARAGRRHVADQQPGVRRMTVAPDRAGWYPDPLKPADAGTQVGRCGVD